VGPPKALTGGPPEALYVHVPFCVARCPYCDFVVLPGAAARGPRNRHADYVEAVAAEIRLRAQPAARLASVYLGGGTPSLLGPDAVGTLLAAARASFAIEPDAEVTLEANPGADERGDARAWRAAGITRISFGAQSLDHDELRALGRRHTPDDVTAAVAEARAAGLASVNVDLLYDVPGQAIGAWAATLDAALDLEPDHLSLYALTLDDADGADHLPVTRGARRWRERARAGQDEDRAAEQYGVAEDRLAAAGYRHYEISNWAKPGHESRHNLAYWRRVPYEAVGPGAHAFDGLTRRWNDAPFDAWADALRDARVPPGGSEAIEPGAAEAERLILGLRLDAGIERAAAETEDRRDAMSWALDVGLLEIAGERVRLTRRGRLLSNEVFARLL
jgi:oxygen-independent coproporphyrinogen-3 oxidase